MIEIPLTICAIIIAFLVVEVLEWTKGEDQ